MNVDSHSKHISKRALLLYSQAGLTDEERMGIEEHLADCVRCAALARRLGCSVRFLDRFAANPSFLLRVPNPEPELKRKPQPLEVPPARASSTSPLSKRKPPIVIPVVVVALAATVVLLAAVSASVFPILDTEADAMAELRNGGKALKRMLVCNEEKLERCSQEFEQIRIKIAKMSDDLATIKDDLDNLTDRARAL